MNDWFYVFTTIFTPLLNISSPKLGCWRRISPAPGYVSSNSGWQWCV